MKVLIPMSWIRIRIRKSREWIREEEYEENNRQQKNNIKRLEDGSIPLI